MDPFSTMLAAAEPPFDAPYFVALVSRVLHTTCGATLLGGLLYLRFVLTPAIESAEGAEATLFAGRRSAWGMCVGVCSALLLASGFYNFFLFNSAYENLPKLYHPLFGVKFLLALGVMLITAFIAGRTGLAQRMRGNARMWLNLAVAMALGIFLLSAMLRSFRDLPDAREAPPASAAEEAPSFGLEVDAGGVEIQIGE